MADNNFVLTDDSLLNTLLLDATSGDVMYDIKTVGVFWKVTTIGKRPKGTSFF